MYETREFWFSVQEVKAAWGYVLNLDENAKLRAACVCGRAGGAFTVRVARGEGQHAAGGPLAGKVGAHEALVEINLGARSLSLCSVGRVRDLPSALIAPRRRHDGTELAVVRSGCRGSEPICTNWEHFQSQRGALAPALWIRYLLSS